MSRPPGDRPSGRPPAGRSPSERGRAETPGGDYPLPLATREALRLDGTRCENPGLTLNRLAGRWSRSGAGWQPPKDEARRRFLAGIADSLRADQPACRLLREALARQRAALAALGAAGWQIRFFRRGTAWRFVTGLGVANPLETGLTLHRIHGYPIIPGSGLKGATLAYLRGLGTADAATLATVFGAPEQAGRVTFFDALPEPPAAGRSLLSVDVMNPHYSAYYESGRPPADYLSPRPVFFLSVRPGVVFHFAVAARDGALSDQASAWLGETLAEAGVGGKTSAGYGVFEEVD